MIQLEETLDIEGLRQRLQRMDDALLLRWGRAAAALSGQREVFRLQARAPRCRCLAKSLGSPAPRRNGSEEDPAGGEFV